MNIYEYANQLICNVYTLIWYQLGQFMLNIGWDMSNLLYVLSKYNCIMGCHGNGKISYSTNDFFLEDIFMPRHQKVAGYYVIPSEILSVRPSVRLSVCLSVRPSVSAHHHSCIGNSSYSFRPILLKLYRCFKDGLKICILFFQNPEIIFYHFFPIFNLDIFRALILQICIWSMYLVSATPPTVFGESFWNFTGVLRMVWRYAYCFFRILKLFFITFYAFLT